MDKPPARWVDMCLEEANEISTGEEVQHKSLLNSIVLVDDAVTNPLSILCNGINVEESNGHVEEKMLEIATIISGG